ncbi:unnamed protein product [Diabrotica balteata]|uniref:C-type lectin domain-containing protein n=1 Tax=Diabrotica balteata TaxID=107213 RepID=A0A9N9XFA0_DIABA|nr:unnamed protein product [Diabrotica balteata]
MNCKIVLLWFMCYICSVHLQKQSDSAFVSPILQTNRRGPNWLTHKGKTYYINNVFRTNFYRSLQFCRQQGMHLLSLKNQEESDLIKNHIETNAGFKHRGYFTSGVNLVGDDQWIWLSTGLDMTYTNWYPGEPSGKSSSNVTENCMEIREWGGFTWNDLNCQLEAYFICESARECQRV